jgi:hypothetical protein
MLDVLFHGLLSEFVGEDGCYGLGVSGFERFDNGGVFKCEARVYAMLKAQGEEFGFGHSHISLDCVDVGVRV